MYYNEIIQGNYRNGLHKCIICIGKILLWGTKPFRVFHAKILYRYCMLLQIISAGSTNFLDRII